VSFSPSLSLIFLSSLLLSDIHPFCSYTGQHRQQRLRPHKPLPSLIPSRSHLNQPSKPRPGFFRASIDFIVVCVCLGVPYLYVRRQGQVVQRYDEEDGGGFAGMKVGDAEGDVVRAVVVGVTTCLLVSLSSSPALHGWTCLTLPFVA
jgi:hypothetical protein